MKKYICLLLVILLLTSVMGTVIAESEEPTQAIVEITVSTAEELLSALGSNRRIFLKEGVYNLTAAAPGFIGSANVFYRECFLGESELVLDKICNLTIQSAGDTQSEIVVEPRYANVMMFYNCENIRIANIKAGHADGLGYCSGGVFAFDNSTGIRVDNTQLFGCGAYGLVLNCAMDVKVTGSTIYECTSGIVNIFDSSDVHFMDCVFRDNTGYTMVYANATSNLTIDSCSFLRNSAGSMFDLPQSDNVLVMNSEFTYNDVEELMTQDDQDIKIDASNRFENNTFDLTNQTEVNIPSFELIPQEVDFEKGHDYPVYTGPGPEYLRSGGGRASVSTNGRILAYVIDISYGIDSGYVLVQYEISENNYRFGYIDAKALPSEHEIPTHLFEVTVAKLAYDTFITDDPFGGQRSLQGLSAGTPVYCLARYDDWVYVEYYPIRGFVPLDRLKSPR